MPLTIDSIFQSYSWQALLPCLPCSHSQKTKTLNTEKPTLCFLALHSGPKPPPHVSALGFKCLSLCLSLCLFITSPRLHFPTQVLSMLPLQAGLSSLSLVSTLVFHCHKTMQEDLSLGMAITHTRVSTAPRSLSQPLSNTLATPNLTSQDFLSCHCIIKYTYQHLTGKDVCLLATLARYPVTPQFNSQEKKVFRYGIIVANLLTSTFTSELFRAIQTIFFSKCSRRARR